MNNSFFKFSNVSFVSIFIIIIFISIFFIPIYYCDYSLDNSLGVYNSIDIANSKYVWPIPGYTKITSPFGKRTAPTAGASTYHKGIDIGAPEGTNLYAICDGKITFANFLGGGGFTITLTTDDGMKITYCHVSPNFIVKVGDIIFKGEQIANVGPKYVYGVEGNTYKDSTGKPTNGSTTGTHLHLGIRVNDEYLNPLSLFENK